MVQKIVALVKQYWDVLMYLVFGVLTTVVNYLVYLPLYNLCGMSAAVSNGIAWAAAVLFAFVTNKPFVFKSHDWSRDVLIPEFVKFLGCRVGSGLMETAILLVVVDILNMNGNVWKLLVSVLVVLLNYFGSKFLVFQSK